jgi:hypothetical protein
MSLLCMTEAANFHLETANEEACDKKNLKNRKICTTHLLGGYREVIERLPRGSSIAEIVKTIGSRFLRSASPFPGFPYNDHLLGLRSLGLRSLPCKTTQEESTTYVENQARCLTTDFDSVPLLSYAGPSVLVHSLHCLSAGHGPDRSTAGTRGHSCPHQLPCRRLIAYSSTTRSLDDR